MKLIYFKLNSPIIHSSIQKLNKFKIEFIHNYYTTLLKKSIYYNIKFKNLFWNLIQNQILTICKLKIINPKNLYINNFILYSKPMFLKHRYQARGRTIIIQKKHSYFQGHYIYNHYFTNHG